MHSDFVFQISSGNVSVNRVHHSKMKKENLKKCFSGECSYILAFLVDNMFLTENHFLTSIQKQNWFTLKNFELKDVSGETRLKTLKN